MSQGYFADDRMIAYTLPLEGHARETQLVLPRRLSRDEAERLVRIVDSLVFDELTLRRDTGVG